jgi:hypothetical protein
MSQTASRVIHDGVQLGRGRAYRGGQSTEAAERFARELGEPLAFLSAKALSCQDTRRVCQETIPTTLATVRVSCNKEQFSIGHWRAPLAS